MLGILVAAGGIALSLTVLLRRRRARRAAELQRAQEEAYALGRREAATAATAPSRD